MKRNIIILVVVGLVGAAAWFAYTPRQNHHCEDTMSYHTAWNLEVNPQEPQTCPTCGHVGDFNYIELIFKKLGFDPFKESCSWPDWETDMRAFSKTYPGLVFTLYANGENNEDIWVAYFRNRFNAGGYSRNSLT